MFLFDLNVLFGVFFSFGFSISRYQFQQVDTMTIVLMECLATVGWDATLKI